MRPSEAEFARLQELELNMRSNLARRNPRLLGDLFLPAAEVDEIGRCLNALLLRRWISGEGGLEYYSLTISLFLVWCAVYHYKEGNLWTPIFGKLEITPNSGRCRELGELFLRTLENYGLELPPAGSHKKYMTPILMHGYISDHYAPQLLDYLNAIYGGYLEYDLSEESLNVLWEDLFNLDQEEIHFRNIVNRLRQEELAIEKSIATLRLPPILAADAKERIDALARQIEQLKRAQKKAEQKQAELNEQASRLGEAISLFRECSAALHGSLAVPAVSGDAAIHSLCAQIEELLGSRLGAVHAEQEEHSRRLRRTQNARKIAEARKNTLLTHLVKLGEGSLEKGYALLGEYTERLQKLERIKQQRARREKILSQQSELGNTSLRQVLTVSLTSLASANPQLFKEFIQSTLQLLHSYARHEVVEQGHRLSGPFKRWAANPRIRHKLPPAVQAPPPKPTPTGQTDVPQPVSGPRRVHLKRPRLRFEPGQRRLSMEMPRQEVWAPAGFTQKPRLFLHFGGNKQEKISCRHEIQRGKLVIDQTSVHLVDSTFSGVSFKCCNWYEYWPLALDPVIVFSADGQQLKMGNFPNGFYYIFAKNTHRPTSRSIAAQYASALDNYTIYEFNGVEETLGFSVSGGEPVALSFSSCPHIALLDMEFIPDLRQDDVGVAKGAPALVMRNDFIEKVGQDGLFILNYNGGRLYEQHLQALCADSGASGASCKIPLQKFFPHQSRSHWQSVEVEIVNAEGETYFSSAFCLVRRLSIALEDGLLKVQVPTSSRLRGNIAKREGKTYWLRNEDGSEITFRIYFPRIGWKDFAVTLPSGECRLRIGDEKLGALPFVLLQTEAEKLRELELDFVPHNSAVQTVIAADEDESLVMKFNALREKVTIPLGNFADLFANKEGTTQIKLRCAGQLGVGKIQSIVEVRPGIEVNEVELFCSEQEREYLLELSFEIDYPNPERLQFRARDEGGQLLFQRKIRSNPDYFFLKKSGLTALDVTVELFYEEELSSVFGRVKRDNLCWQSQIKLPNLKAVYGRLEQGGLALTGFTYGQKYYALPGLYTIENISVSSKNFAGEELLNGLFVHGAKSTKVYFYVDFIEDRPVISVLWDQEDDALQYDCREQTLFWEVRAGRHILGPLENFEFRFLGSE